MNKHRIHWSLSALLLISVIENTSANLVSYETRSVTPSTDGLDFFTLHSADTLGAGYLNLGLSYDFSGTRETQAVLKDLEKFSNASIYGAYGLNDRLDVGLYLSYILSSTQGSSVLGSYNSTGGLHEFRMNAKYKLLPEQDQIPGISIVPSINVPLFDSSIYFGSNPKTIFNLEVALSKRFGKLKAALNTGYRFRSTTQSVFPTNTPLTLVEAQRLEIDDQFLASTGLSYELTSLNSWLFTEINTATLAKRFYKKNDTTVEWLGGFRSRVNSVLALHGGGAYAVEKSFGFPQWRIFMGMNLRWDTNPYGDINAPTSRVKKVKNFIDYEEKILFEYNSSVLNEISFKTLNGIVNFVKYHPEIQRIEIQGFTDSKGSKAYNKRLSLERSEVVRDYLLKRGLPPEMLVSRGYGEATSTGEPYSRQAQAANRRVQFKILIEIVTPIPSVDS